MIGLSACSETKGPEIADGTSTKSNVSVDSPEPAVPKPVVNADGIDVPPKVEPPANPIRPQAVRRPDDLRRPHDDAKLAEAGIPVFESKHLKLYTDIDANVARTLPLLIDQVYVAWEDYFGPFPADRKGTDFQLSGYLMRDMALFRELSLVPEELFIEHGRNLRNEFWMRDQKFDYYREHLLIHESTHCFMTFLPDSMGPVWYMEGMAEYFGSHRLDAERRATFRVMPTSEREFAGFARIMTIREEVAQGKFLSIPVIRALKPAEFLSVHHYAWSWALCIFLDQTPRYQERFQTLGRLYQGSQFARMFDQSFAGDQRDLATEWALFAGNLMYGYDTARAAIDFRTGSELKDERTVQIEANRGWQSSGILVEKGRVYKIAATGRFTLADQPKPWVSEPQGISFRYFDGRPIGTLMGCLRTEEGSTGGENESMLGNFAIGREHEFHAPATGTLYLRLNDAWNSLHDNNGHADVTIQSVAAP